jgi:hypothetical protein
MMFGSVALGLYSIGVCYLTGRGRVSALLATVLMLPVWLGCAFALK